MSENRIEILKEILLELHHGASADSVQERFNQHFTGVSALEVSMMEHELMSSDTGITFEDIMGLCNVHANLFKGAVQDVEVADADQEGHPVYVFKQENLALRAAMLRIRRILDNLAKPENVAFADQLTKGLKHQMMLLGQFDNHYTRKEELFFPIMERYGHDAPPKVMWGVDDNIRDLFAEAKNAMDFLPDTSLEMIKEKFEAFASEFEEMIFKEESILLMILLDTFTQDDWLTIAKDSDKYGYAIIKPTQEWQPHREDFLQTNEQTVDDVEAKTQENEYSNTKTIETDAGTLSITFTPKEKEEVIDRNTPQPFGNGYLSVEQANLILNHLPMEITFVNKEDIFQYYNDYAPTEDMIFKRNPSQVGRHVELCHPPRVLEKVKKVIELLKSGQKDKVTMWFKSEKREIFVHITYAAVRNADGEFEGVLEYVQEIQDFRAIDTDFNRDVL
ncbi:DUF438 domain-containing protein [Streptococcus thoraltensis]|uniref:DUF438 domain-containing protein n=1 Tax=Streptococcus thoraltensis TaxID=55085 RepID=UPI0003761DE1|nr:DUF438 domain-containing protein [Streptococcus thoraltensis]MDY4760975.1 DUF438 domain-containing protein [Streptococcus thoraltensis]